MTQIYWEAAGTAELHPAQHRPVVDGAFPTTLPHFFGIYGFAGGYRSILGEKRFRDPRGSALSLKSQGSQTLIKHSSGIQGGQTLNKSHSMFYFQLPVGKSEPAVTGATRAFPLHHLQAGGDKSSPTVPCPSSCALACPSQPIPFLPQPAECQEMRNKCNTEQSIREL